MPLDTTILGLEAADKKGEGSTNKRPYPAVFIRAPAVLEVCLLGRLAKCTTGSPRLAGATLSTASRRIYFCTRLVSVDSLSYVLMYPAWRGFSARARFLIGWRADSTVCVALVVKTPTAQPRPLEGEA